MSETPASLNRKIGGARDLQSVVRAMKAVAASNVRQYQESVRGLADYYHTVELGLSACFRQAGPTSSSGGQPSPLADRPLYAIVFGSDKGLVGPFNDRVTDSVMKALAPLPGTPRVWAVGERVQARLADAGLAPAGVFSVPTSINGITPLVGEIIVKIEALQRPDDLIALHLFYNRPTSGAAYAPVSQRLLPLDEAWRRRLIKLPWPSRNLPEIMGGSTSTLQVLIRQYLFVSLFRACAESLASENASRLAAMQRADTNIDQLLADLTRESHRLRQGGIDEELFDVLSGFEALSGVKERHTGYAEPGGGPTPGGEMV